jgi:hypothetical protein
MISRQKNEALTLNDIWGLAFALLPSLPMSDLTKVRRERSAFVKWFSESEYVQRFFEDTQATPESQGHLSALIAFMKAISALPLELRMYIAQHALPCTYQSLTIVVSETRPLLEHLRDSLIDGRRQISLNLQKENYATQVIYDGISYITGFRDQPSPFLRCIHKGSRVRRIVLALDEIGVVDIQFLEELSGLQCRRRYGPPDQNLLYN